MALLARQPRLHVTLVWKVHEPGELVDTHPLPRAGFRLRAKVRSFSTSFWSSASFEATIWWQPMQRLTDGMPAKVERRRPVAVLAVDLEVAGVDLVAEEDGLLGAGAIGACAVAGMAAIPERIRTAMETIRPASTSRTRPRIRSVLVWL